MAHVTLKQHNEVLGLNQARYTASQQTGEVRRSANRDTVEAAAPVLGPERPGQLLFMAADAVCMLAFSPFSHAASKTGKFTSHRRLTRTETRARANKTATMGVASKLEPIRIHRFGRKGHP